MNSPKPHHDDELGDLIQETLQTYTSNNEPTDEMWQRIQDRLERPKPSPSPAKPIFWPPPLVQAVFAVLIVILGGIGVPTRPSPDESISVLSSTVARADLNNRFIDEYTVQPLQEPAADPASPATLSAAQHNMPYTGAAIVAFPEDVLPHPLSPQGRILYARHLADKEDVKPRKIDYVSVTQSVNSYYWPSALGSQLIR